MDLTNIFEIVNYAENLGLEILSLASSKFIIQHFDEVKNMNGFMGISPQLMKGVLADDDLQAESERGVALATLAWINHDITFSSAFQFINYHIAEFCFRNDCSKSINIVQSWGNGIWE